MALLVTILIAAGCGSGGTVTETVTTSASVACPSVLGPGTIGRCSPACRATLAPLIGLYGSTAQTTIPLLQAKMGVSPRLTTADLRALGLTHAQLARDRTSIRSVLASVTQIRGEAVGVCPGKIIRKAIDVNVSALRSYL